MITNLVHKAIRTEDIRGSTILYGEYPYTLSYSYSLCNVIRGLHLLKSPVAKKIHLLSGTIFDVLVDLRNGAWNGYVLDAPYDIYCPVGYAHGFAAITDAEIIYEWIPFWDVDNGEILCWDDSYLNIPWKEYIDINNVILSESDRDSGKSFDEIRTELTNE